jgi:hypothetical protein
MKLVLFIIGGALLAIFALTVLMSLTDIKRYIRINRM